MFVFTTKIATVIILFSLISFYEASGQRNHDVPTWVRDIAQLWVEEQIDDYDFASVIRYMVNQNTEKNWSTTNSNFIIPHWVKTNTWWWIQGLISDNEYINMIQYLVYEKTINMQESEYSNLTLENHQISSEKESFIEVESHDIVKPERDSIHLKIYGKVSANGKLFISLTKPDGSTIELKTYSTHQGDFNFPLLIDKYYLIGKYEISANYNNIVFNSNSFNIVHKNTSFPTNNFQNNIKKNTEHNFFNITNITRISKDQVVEFCTNKSISKYKIMNTTWICSRSNNIDYIIYQDEDIINAKNTKSDKIDFSSTDAADIIQMAINTLNDGGRILIKSGTYEITHTILINSNIVLEGEGWDTVLKLKEHVNMHIIQEKGLGNNKILIKNIQIDGNKENQDHTGGRIGIVLHESFESVIDHVYVRNTDGIAIAIATNPMGTDQIRKHQLIVNSVIDSPRTDGVWFMGNNGFIINNFIKNYNDTGIAASRCFNCTVSNNTIIGSPLSYGSGIAVGRGAENVTVSNNFLINSNIGVLLTRVNLPYSAHNVGIVNNSIINSKDSGIILQHHAYQVKIINNQIIDNIKNGIQMTSNDTSIVNNTIEHNGYNGIIIYGSLETTIENNIIKNNGQSSINSYDGILVDGNSNKTIVKNNFIGNDQLVHTQMYGVRIISGSDNRIINNTFFGNTTSQIKGTYLQDQ